VRLHSGVFLVEELKSGADPFTRTDTEHHTSPRNSSRSAKRTRPYTVGDSGSSSTGRRIRPDIAG
jgi:hypothetical protein